jgi:hypothetical protein
MALEWISGGRVALEFSANCLKFPVLFPVTGNFAENGSLWTGSSAISAKPLAVRHQHDLADHASAPQ